MATVDAWSRTVSIAHRRDASPSVPNCSTPAGPTDLVEAVRHLTFLQVDPTAAIAPNADLVAWSRLGGDYAPADLVRALEEDRALIEFDALIRPMEDLALYRADMERSPEYPRSREWLRSERSFRRDVLARLRDAGPLTSRDIPDTSVVPWSSSGWTGNRNVTQMLEFLALRGEVAIVGRRKRERVWDLAERAYPADLATVPADEQRRIRDERRLRSLGIARAKSPAMPMEPADVGAAGEPAVVEGVAGEWRVDPGARSGSRSRAARPCSRRSTDSSHNRTRALELFEFDYTLEMYKPADEAAVGLLRAADPARRSTGRQARRAADARPACSP